MVSSSHSLALDPRALDRLRSNAGAEPEGALREAARQFEVLFMNMLLKSMREAAPQDGPLDSDQTRMYTSMLDQQLAQAMANRGIGLADVMVRQLTRSAGAAGKEPGAAAPGAPVPASASDKPAVEAPAAAGPKATVGAHSRDFVNRFWPHAVDASRMTGLPPHFILGQAALESGWGTREVRGSDGTPTHNLFNIKAGGAWRGDSAETLTTEYVGGAAQKQSARFRSYASYADAFRDYATLLKTNARYSRVLESGADAAAFGRELQKAGYATDPAYADKLTRIITGNVLRGGLST
ncbi:MAG: flagellar assembly peptidoglycan hydrolase FlgJ [Burkholderiales bacterium]